MTHNESTLINIIRQAQDPTTALLKAIEIITMFINK